eukprot:scaffold1769_cov277-Prasinococcus_capsulatus_cf.AAC.7
MPRRRRRTLRGPPARDASRARRRAPPRTAVPVRSMRAARGTVADDRPTRPGLRGRRVCARRARSSPRPHAAARR